MPKPKKTNGRIGLESLEYELTQIYLYVVLPIMGVFVSGVVGLSRRRRVQLRNARGHLLIG